MKVMNACPLKPEKYDIVVGNSNYITEEKLKGIRATVKFGEDQNIITSRGGFDISHRFPHIATCLVPRMWDITLDGELFQRGVEDEIIAGWGNHRTKHINPSVTHGVNFHYFDVIYYDVLRERKQKLLMFQKVLINTPFKHVPWFYQNTKTAAIEHYTEIISSGGEGIMLKNLVGTYVEGKRPQNNWYKMKKTKTFDVVITGFEMAKEQSIKKGGVQETDTKFKGLIGAFTYGIPPTDPSKFTGDTCEIITVGTCSGMSDEIRKDMTYYPARWIGLVVEVEGVEKKKSGCIDNPRYKRITGEI